MQAFLGAEMTELDPHFGLDVLDRSILPVVYRVAFPGGVVDPPNVVMVTVGVESDLLFCG
jgi:hypothetical protein